MLELNSLRLGMRFHRSGIKMKASQVSYIPSGLSSRWSKTRRFQLTWNLIRRIKPARLLKMQLSVDEDNKSSSAYLVPMTTKSVTKAYLDINEGKLLTALLHP